MAIKSRNRYNRYGPPLEISPEETKKAEEKHQEAIRAMAKFDKMPQHLRDLYNEVPGFPKLVDGKLPIPASRHGLDVDLERRGTSMRDLMNNLFG